MPILDWEIAATPFAVIDIETTGFNPGHDRVIEVAVVHVSASEPPQVVFESLVNPMRVIGAAAGKHGIAISDLESAPRFEVVAAKLSEVLAGRVVAAHNVHFDVRFLQFELGQVGVTFDPPYACTMNLRPFLRLGPRASLEEACAAIGIEDCKAREAVGDAMASARLLKFYLRQMEARGISKFQEMIYGETPEFCDSWHKPTLAPTDFAHLTHGKPRSRGGPPSRSGSTATLEIAKAFPLYSFALLDAISDFVITDEDVEGLKYLRDSTDLSEEQLRAVHASVFIWTLSEYAGDHALDDQERDKLRQLHQCLSRLGWAPGE
jgi:DNA polymerase-3 subunit epsilon